MNSERAKGKPTKPHLYFIAGWWRVTPHPGRNTRQPYTPWNRAHDFVGELNYLLRIDKHLAKRGERRVSIRTQRSADPPHGCNT